MTFAVLPAPASTEAAVGGIGPTVSLVAAVPVKLAVLPAVSVVTTETVTEPSVSDEPSIPEAVVDPPQALHHRRGTGAEEGAAQPDHLVATRQQPAPGLARSALALPYPAGS